MEKRDINEQLIKELEDIYNNNGYGGEPIYDGPSNWNSYENSSPKIVFLAKESHGSYHPANERIIDDRFTKIIGIWASIINSGLQNGVDKCDFSRETIQRFYSSVAIVEVKKIDTDSSRSSDTDLKKMTWLGRELLKQQMELLTPDIVVCLGTIEYFDIINNYSEEERNAKEKQIDVGENRRCWNSNGTIIIDSYHPSYWTLTEERLCEIFKNLFSNQNLINECLQVIKQKKINNQCPNSATSPVTSPSSKS